MIRKRVLVAGLVQGVFFRDTCRRVAVEHGVAGCVSVEPAEGVRGFDIRL